MNALILHSVCMRKVQTASILVSVALSVALALVLGMIYGGVMRGIDVSSQRTGADLLVVPKDARTHLDDGALLYTGVPAPFYMTEDVEQAIAELDGVEATSSQFFSQTLNASCCSAGEETRLIGIDPETDFVVSPLLPEGSSDALGEDEVIVGSGVTGIAGGALFIYGKPYDVVGTMAESGGDLDHSIIMSMDAARRISAETDGLKTTWERYGSPDELVSAIMVQATDDAEAYEKLKIKLNLTEGISYVENAKTAEQVTEQLRSVFALLAGAAIVMMVITLLQLFARFYSCAWDRKSELALYRAIGASKRDVRCLIGGEIALVVMAGLVVGFALGVILYQAILGLLQDSIAFPFIGMDAGAVALLVAAIAALFAIISALSVAWPLYQIGKLDPSLAMQQGDID